MDPPHQQNPPKSTRGSTIFQLCFLKKASSCPFSPSTQKKMNQKFPKERHKAVQALANSSKSQILLRWLHSLQKLDGSIHNLGIDLRHQLLRGIFRGQALGQLPVGRQRDLPSAPSFFEDWPGRDEFWSILQMVYIKWTFCRNFRSFLVFFPKRTPFLEALKYFVKTSWGHICLQSRFVASDAQKTIQMLLTTEPSFRTRTFSGHTQPNQPTNRPTNQPFPFAQLYQASFGWSRTAQRPPPSRWRNTAQWSRPRGSLLPPQRRSARFQEPGAENASSGYGLQVPNLKSENGKRKVGLQISKILQAAKNL